MLDHHCVLNELLYLTIEGDLHCMISEGQQPVNFVGELFWAVKPAWNKYVCMCMLFPV